MIEVRQLGEGDIPRVHQLSFEIFGEGALADKYSVEKWREHLHENGLLLGAFEGAELIGFKFGYQREPGRFHSWLGGVRPLFRRRGAMRALTQTQESWARANGFEAITVNTFQEKFPQMYQFLLGEGYEIITTNDPDEKKIHFQKNLLT